MEYTRKTNSKDIKLICDDNKDKLEINFRRNSTTNFPYLKKLSSSCKNIKLDEIDICFIIKKMTKYLLEIVDDFESGKIKINTKKSNNTSANIENNYTFDDSLSNSNIAPKTNSLSLSSINPESCNKNGIESSKFDYTKVFSSNLKPKISLEEYFIRIAKYTTPENSTILLTFILIDKLCNTKKIELRKDNIYNIAAVAFYSAVKYNEDILCRFSSYVKIFSIPKETLIELEFYFSEILEYKYFINEAIYTEYMNSIIKNYSKHLKRQNRSINFHLKNITNKAEQISGKSCLSEDNILKTTNKANDSNNSISINYNIVSNNNSNIKQELETSDNKLKINNISNYDNCVDIAIKNNSTGNEFNNTNNVINEETQYNSRVTSCTYVNSSSHFIDSIQFNSMKNKESSGSKLK